MKGLSVETENIFEKISKLNCIKEYTLIGGTALSLQINNRLSEDLDFCKWGKNKSEKPEVDWPEIEKQLKTIGKVKTEVIDLNNVIFIVNGVKVSFYANQLYPEPQSMIRRTFINELNIADIDAIGIMKIELMLRRSKFRDYYDIYSILMENRKLEDLINRASIYCGHKFKTKNMEAILTDGKRFEKEKEFELLKPKYNVSATEIEDYILNHIRSEKIQKGILKDPNIETG
jgi:hypothetical protein